MRHVIGRIAALAFVSASFLAGVAGCNNATLQQQQQQVQAQQQQIEQQQQMIESLKQQQPAYNPGVGSAPGGCDRATEQTAAQRGGSKYIAGSYQKALDYYKDALSACPGDPKAEINVARAYEALGDRQQAIEHYRAAASSGDPEAQNALSRLTTGNM
jgi:tetratricopeptide (TPR) repeat protein